MADLLAIVVRLKFVVPFLVLLVLKLIADNFIPSLIIISTTVSIFRIKSSLDMQLALKKRSSVFTLTNLLVLCAFVMFVSTQCSRVFKLPDNLGHRLIMSYGMEKSAKSMSFLNTVWCCLIVDGIVQTGVLSLQISSCLVIGSRSFKFGDLKKLFSVEQLRNNLNRQSGSHRTHSHNSPAIQTANNNFDLESGTNGTPAATTTLPRSASDTSLYAQLFNQSESSLSSLLGLARRPTISVAHSVTSQHTSSSSHSHTTTTTSSVSSGVASHVHSSPYSHDHAPAGTDNSSSDSDADSAQEAVEYLQRLRLCSLLDMVGLVYRSFLPMPLWLLYFKGDGLGSSVFPSIYVGIKLMDLSWKVRGLSEAMVHYFGQTLEFGHYSTPVEVATNSTNGAPHDCPVCFDRPKTPVTLDCKHVFCEMCIAEWIDKEKTCPVCRAEVRGVSPLIRSMKEECVHYVPIFT